MIAAPGFKSGKTSSQSEHLDIFPTICNLAGVPIPKQLQGKSLKPLMLNNKTTVKDFSVSQYPRKLQKEEVKKMGYDDNKIMGYSIRTNKYRYTIWMSSFTSDQPFAANKIYASEMYDYVKDPLEKINVVNNKKYAAASKEMYNKIILFFKSQEKN
jgi:arylsulfatase A-like enzyme